MRRRGEEDEERFQAEEEPVLHLRYIRNETITTEARFVAWLTASESYNFSSLFCHTR